jgi:hypothetical protein
MKRIPLIIPIIVGVVSVIVAVFSINGAILSSRVTTAAENPQTVILEDCEYFLFTFPGGHYRIIHKGSCQNHIRPRAIITTGNRQ